jgi:glucokinase
MALFTIGTGIGGGIILDGKLVRGAHGIAGELGHTTMVPGGYPCGCGRHGCAEQYASGRALVRFARAGAVVKPEAAERLLELAGGEVDAIKGPIVTRAARAGDPTALAAFDQVGHWLGIAMADLVQVIDPQVIVIGGGVAEAGELLMRPTRAGYERALAQRGRLPVAEVRPALLGNTAGVIGAADLARRQ